MDRAETWGVLAQRPSPPVRSGVRPHCGPDLCQRLERLPWSRWHRRVGVAFGGVLLLNGLQAALATTSGLGLADAATRVTTDLPAGSLVGAYLGAAVAGAVLLGLLADRQGRRPALLAAVAASTVLGGATAAAAPAAPLWGLALLAGFGLGVEAMAIATMVSEIMPARHRGSVSLAVAGCYWVGVAGGGLFGAYRGVPHIPAPPWSGAALGVAVGAVLVVSIAGLVPESPRWLRDHGRLHAAELAVKRIERHVLQSAGGWSLSSPVPEHTVSNGQPQGTASRGGFRLLGCPRPLMITTSLFAAQAFLYTCLPLAWGGGLPVRSIISTSGAPVVVIAVACAFWAGPLALTQLFDSRGRRAVLAGSCLISAGLLLATGEALRHGVVNPTPGAELWVATFFFGSAAAGAGYLTAARHFPRDIRAGALAVSFGVGTLGGAVVGLLWLAHLGLVARSTVLWWSFLVAIGIIGLGALLQVVLAPSARLVRAG